MPDSTRVPQEAARTRNRRNVIEDRLDAAGIDIIAKDALQDLERFKRATRSRGQHRDQDEFPGQATGVAVRRARHAPVGAGGGGVVRTLMEKRAMDASA